MENVTQHRRHFFRFSLRTLLLFVFATSLALAAMRYATTAWASSVVTVTVLTLLASFVLAACRRGERRSFWIGIAICGTGYFVVVTSPYLLAPEILRTLATSRAVALLRDNFHSPQGYPIPIDPGMYTAANPGRAMPAGPFYPVPPDAPLLPSQAHSNDDTSDYATMTTNFLLIGQCIWTLIFAALGGMLARFAAGRATSS